MGLTYTIIGTDGQQYGPITLEQLRVWMREGRVTRETQVWRSDTSAWVPAVQYTELGLGATPVAVPASGVAATGDPTLERRLRISADWFIWIAALSLVNSVIRLSGGRMFFIFGLGVTQVIDSFATGLASGGTAVAFGLDLVAAGVFALFGFFGRKRQTWSFAVGMSLYALDAVIYVLGGDWLSVAFHGYVLYRMFGGLQASGQLNGMAKRVVAPSV